MKKIIRLSIICLFAVVSQQTVKAQTPITRIYTDYNPETKMYNPPGIGGLWDSQTYTAAADRPRNQHHLLAFEWNNNLYSTGIDDAKLTNNGLNFTSVKFQALPVENFVPSGSTVYIQLGEFWDGVENGLTGPNDDTTNVLPPPFSVPQGVGTVLTHGLQGLDLGSAITNIPASTPLKFNFGSITSPETISDGVPDIIVTQTASPQSRVDEIWFEDGNGNTIGNTIELNFMSFPHVGDWYADFFIPFTGVVPSTNQWINSVRQLRLLALEASDFGLNSTNYEEAKVLVYHLQGSSDVAFVAFNTDFIQLTVANGDESITNKNTPIDLNILENDTPNNVNELSSFTVPETTNQGGTIVQNSNGTVTYTPPTDFVGTDTFIYEICTDNDENCATAIVVIRVIDSIIYDVCLNSDITLEVSLEAGKQFDIVWTLPNHSTIETENPALPIEHATGQDAGLYVLEATNVDDSTEKIIHQFTLNVKKCRVVTNPVLINQARK